MLVLAWRSGLRIGEVLALLPKDLDLERGTARIQRGKGDRFRVVGLDSGTVAVVGRWLEVRRKLNVPRRAPLICTLRGTPMRQDYVRHLLPRLARRARIDKRVHAHGLRHAFAVELDREGLSLSSIGTLLGHASAATTAIYLRRHGADAAIDFARAREWSL
jgi:site-specific recombinase XerD